jgi:hypothetical protein
VEIAVGDDHLNRVADFMENRLWSRALDELDKTPEFSKPESEAYRQYDLGLAHEAMAYDAKVFKDQQTDLFAAQEYYDKALELNRKEKYFVTAVARMKDALARYKAFEGMQKQDSSQQTKKATVQNAVPAATTVQATAAKTQITPAKAPAASGVTAQNAAPGAPKALAPQTPAALTKTQNPAAQTPRPLAAKAAAPPNAPPKSQSKTLGIGDVIEMFTSGVPEGQIVEIIQHAPVQFDALDKDTAIAIARARLPLTLQNELRKKVGAPLLQPARPAAGK